MPFKVYVGNGGCYPMRADVGSAGWDLYASEDTIVPATRLSKTTLVPTAIKVELPKGTYGRIAPRSGLAYKHGIDIAAGVIDRSYRGEIGVLMVNHGVEEYKVKKGDRIAQLIITMIHEDMYEIAEYESDLHNTSRGGGGFGSSGV